MTLLAPQALWLLALLPVVVVLHFLRARRRERPVTALFLWRRAQANVARRKRFSPSWLLALQLAFVALAALALARPQPATSADKALVIVIDASASMTARSGDGTRFDLARAAARDLLSGASRVALVRAGDSPRLLAPLDAPRAELLGALEGLRAGDATGDLLGAVDLGRSLLPGADIEVITDHRVELGRPAVVVVGEPVDNVGISAFDVGIGQAFVAVVASGRLPAEVTVGLFSQGSELARSTLLVPSGSSGSVTFPLLDDQSAPVGILEARILAPTPDALALDDVAYAGRRVLTVVTDDFYAPLLRALQAAPGVTVFGAADATRRPADLRVVTAPQPAGSGGVDALPPGDYILFPPPAREPEYHLVRDVDRAAPVMRFVDLNEALVGIDKSAPGWADSEADGWRVLARADDLTPLLRMRRTASGSILQFGIHPSQSDVVLRPAFPALVANWVAALDSTPRLRLGDTIPGQAAAVLEPGVYSVSTGERLDSLSGAQVGAAGRSEPVALVSLLSAEESRLPTGAPGPAAREGEAATGADRAAASAASNGRAPSAYAAPSLWVTLLLVVALIALAAEWWLYSGRRGRGLVG
jgi:hypothetical protein